jgi:hypothetical protein
VNTATNVDEGRPVALGVSISFSDTAIQVAVFDIKALFTVWILAKALILNKP